MMTQRSGHVAAGARWAAAAVVVALVVSLQAGGQEKEATPKRQSVQSLKQIVIALHSYHDAYRQMPASANVDFSVRAQFGNPMLTGEQLAKAKAKVGGKTLPLR